jgi:nitrite reductase/ring-hydroxylating ferredoxin subunit
VEEATGSASWRCPADALGPGQTAKFQLQRHGRTVPGFVVNFEGRRYAYINRCPHAGTPLDWWPNEFFTEDGRHLICATHGAVFEPRTGLCIEGPCPGARLEALAVQEDGDGIVITWRT